MLKRITLLIVASLLATFGIGTITSTAEAAQAKRAWGTSVAHAADDSGYVSDIQVVCNGGKRLFLGLGQSTFLQSGDGCPLSGVATIVVGYNQTVFCKNLVPPYTDRYFYTGTTAVPSNATYKCYMQRPI